MDYGKLGKERNQTDDPSKQGHYAGQSSSDPTTTTSNSKTKLILIIAFTLIVVSLVSVGLVVRLRTHSHKSESKSMIHPRPTEAMSRVCGRTRYPNLCLNSLLNFPGSLIASEKDMMHISVNMTLQRVGKALYTSSDIKNIKMNTRVRSAYDDCVELLDDSIDHLSRSLSSITSSISNTNNKGSTEDVLTWLSAALTNQDTCTDGLSEAENGYVKEQMSDKLKDLSELVSNSLAIFAAANDGNEFKGVPIENKRRRRLLSYPKWFGRKERRLLEATVAGMQADIVVSKDGSATCKTIAEAIKLAPEGSNRRVIIYVKAGRYEEDNLKVGRKKTNLMFIGDGKGKTVITGGVNRLVDDVTTFHTASFAATGAGFIARDISFENYAGPAKHQAVALRIGADRSVVYRCAIIGYQDTLYVHSQRQFFRECDIYGTVDFIFGNAAVVFQSCNIYARKPMPLQKVTITAQNRKDPNQNTGISIHACRLLAQPDLEASKASFPTFLGRPWKLYARTVYMQSYMGDHIDTKGWLEWNGAFALDTLYYGEYMNNGPGAAVGGRVNWPGYRVITTTVEATRFTVGQFIYGSSWLPSTGVSFIAGLSP